MNLLAGKLHVCHVCACVYSAWGTNKPTRKPASQPTNQQTQTNQPTNQPTFVAEYTAWFGMPATALKLAIDTTRDEPPVSAACCAPTNVTTKQEKLQSNITLASELV